MKHINDLNPQPPFLLRPSTWLVIFLIASISAACYYFLWRPHLKKSQPTIIQTTFDFVHNISKTQMQPGRALNIQHWQTTQGTQVYFVASPELPIVDIRFIFSAGAARDGQIPGIAKLTNAMIGEGTSTHTSDEIVAAFEQLGAQVQTDADRDMAVLELRSLTHPEYLQPTLALVSEIISQPTFPATAFQRNLNLMRLNLEGEKQDPDALAERALFAHLYPNHPYQTMPDGTVDSLKTITIKDLQTFYQRYYVGKNCTLVIVGALNRAQAEAMAQQLTAQLPVGEAPTELPKALALTAPIQQHISFPSTQTHIQLATSGITYNDADYFPLLVGNYILGGGSFSSILNKTIRQDRGLSYSVYSGLNPMQGGGPFIIGLQTKNESAAEALQLTKTTLAHFIAQGPTAEQLKQAKEYLLASFPMKAASNGSILDYLGLIGFYHLPIQYLETYREKISQVTMEQIKQAFETHIRLNQAAIITVGPNDIAAPQNTAHTIPVTLNHAAQSISLLPAHATQKKLSAHQ